MLTSIRAALIGMPTPTDAFPRPLSEEHRTPGWSCLCVALFRPAKPSMHSQKKNCEVRPVQNHKECELAFHNRHPNSCGTLLLCSDKRPGCLQANVAPVFC